MNKKYLINTTKRIKNFLNQIYQGNYNFQFLESRLEELKDAIKAFPESAEPIKMLERSLIDEINYLKKTDSKHFECDISTTNIESIIAIDKIIQKEINKARKEMERENA